MGVEASRTCGRCGVELLESNMVEHLKTCQKLQGELTRPDGSKLNFEYKAPNGEYLSKIMNKAINYRDEQSKALQ